MDKIERIQQVETAINEVNTLVGFSAISEKAAAPVLRALRRKLDVLRSQFEAEWADYIEAHHEEQNA